MKVICVDNYDRPGYLAKVIAENVSNGNAHRIARLLNEEEDELSEDYFMVVSDDWRVEDTI